MLKYYGTAAGAKGAEELTERKKGCWIYLENPSDHEIESIARDTSVSEELIKAALDEEERARIEADGEAKLVIVDIPIMTEENDWYVYGTLPLGIILTEDYFITVCIKGSTILNDFINGRVKNFDINKHTRFLYQLLYCDAVKFLQNLRQIDKASHRVQTQLHKSMKNKELIQLLDLEKSLVYFSTSLNSNQIVMDKIVQTTFVKHYPEDQEILEDVVIENKQAMEMCTIYRDILSGTMDAFASVISNNQNIVTKFLAAITILLAIPQVIASFFGMNVGVPFEGKIVGFWCIVAISCVLMVVVLAIMVRRKMF